MTPTTNQKLVENLNELVNRYFDSDGACSFDLATFVLKNRDTIIAALKAMDRLPKLKQDLRLARRALLFVTNSNVPSEVRTLARNVAGMVQESAGTETHLPGCAFDSNHPDESTGSCIPGCPIGEASAMTAYFAGPLGIAALAASPDPAPSDAKGE